MLKKEIGIMVFTSHFKSLKSPKNQKWGHGQTSSLLLTETPQSIHCSSAMHHRKDAHSHLHLIVLSLKGIRTRIFNGVHIVSTERSPRSQHVNENLSCSTAWIFEAENTDFWSCSRICTFFRKDNPHIGREMCRGSICLMNDFGRQKMHTLCGLYSF